MWGSRSGERGHAALGVEVHAGLTGGRLPACWGPWRQQASWRGCPDESGETEGACWEGEVKAPIPSYPLPQVGEAAQAAGLAGDAHLERGLQCGHKWGIKQTGLASLKESLARRGLSPS